MKRKVASRKLKRTCCQCDQCFKKGDVYYLKRFVFSYGKYVSANENIYCPKCKYRNESSRKRYEAFKPICHHPVVNEVWSTIPDIEL
ncbi:hypothetical protein [Heyndrickxia sporothermodurans]|uniref:hypothetical protein n=1 Tax=Heyndrickxia sporothermodurans TaxID=46224 RepID=UPI0035DA09E3